MRLTLHDFENPRSPEHGLQTETPEVLASILDRLQQREPFIVELESDYGFRLTIGIGGPIACAQHSTASGDTPYLVAIGNASVSQNDEATTFLCGGTPTPIASRHSLPFESLKRIATHFLQTGQPTSELPWEEV